MLAFTMRTYIKHVKLARWFPPNDPLSVKIARLCIIREDLVTECHGVLAERIEELDEVGERLRRIYFLRSCVRSLQELSSVVHSLLGDARFKRLIERQNKSVKAEFQQLKSVQNEVGKLIKNLRNDICGHVRESAVQEALQRIADHNPDASGFLEISPSSFHLKFAHELTAEILLKDVSAEERHTHTSKKYAEVRRFLPALGIIQQCIAMYLEDRGFFD